MILKLSFINNRRFIQIPAATGFSCQTNFRGFCRYEPGTVLGSRCDVDCVIHDLPTVISSSAGCVSRYDEPSDCQTCVGKRRGVKRFVIGAPGCVTCAPGCATCEQVNVTCVQVILICVQVSVIFVQVNVIFLQVISICVQVYAICVLVNAICVQEYATCALVNENGVQNAIDVPVILNGEQVNVLGSLFGFVVVPIDCVNDDDSWNETSCDFDVWHCCRHGLL